MLLDTIRLRTEAQAVPLVLEALIGLAHLQAQAGDAERALELSMCVLSHTASTQQAKDRAERLRLDLESRLTPQQIETARARQRANAFETIVNGVLDGSCHCL